MTKSVLVPVELLETTKALCDAIENRDDLQLNKWALKCGFLVNKVKAMLVAAPNLHTDDIAVNEFAEAMKAKLEKKRDEGRGGWDSNEPGMNARLSEMLYSHVMKGDPVDVANFAMMLYMRGENIATDLLEAAPKVEDEPVAYMKKSTVEHFKKHETCGEAYSIEMIFEEGDECIPLYASPQSEMKWLPMDTAPTDGTLILGLCKDGAAEVFEADGKTLTTYQAHAESVGHVTDGPHVLEWGGGYKEFDEYSGKNIHIANWWFRYGSEFEEAANPIGWLPIPTNLK